MRRLAVFVLLTACKHPGPVAHAEDHAAAPSASSASSVASAPPPAPAAPRWELVANAKTWPWDDAISRGLPHAASASVEVVGELPHAFAFRRDDVPCYAIDNPQVVVRGATAWGAPIPLKREPVPPHAVVAWQGGMLLVDSLIQPCGWATSNPLEAWTKGPGTTFTFVDARGAVTHPTLDLDPHFIAWDASSTGDDLALVGTFGDPKSVTRDIAVVRRHAAGPWTTSVLLHGTGWRVQSQRTGVAEFGGAALVWGPPAHDDGSLVKGAPTEGGDEITWKGHASSIFVIDEHGTRELRFRAPNEGECRVSDAAYVSGDVFAMVRCADGPARLRRVTETAREDVALACEPELIAVHAGELWMRGACGVYHRTK